MEDIPSPDAAAGLAKTKLRDSGAFSFRQGHFPKNMADTSLPPDLGGRSILLNEDGRDTLLRFPSPGTVSATTPGGNTVSGTYSYDPIDSTRASLELNFLNSPGLGLSLELTAPGTGRFDEIPPANGGGQPMRRGGFSLPDDQLPPDNPDCPPDEIAGLSYIIDDSSPCTLTFFANGTGEQCKREDGVLETVSFVYSYSRTGGDSASVVITYPGATADLIDQYELHFSDDCRGTFHRESSTDGASSGSEAGTFGPGNAAGAGAAGAGAPLPGLGR
jgi:hypothetical protein